MQTRLTDLFGCKHPIVQTGMGWVSGARLTAATTAAGGFGFLATITMTDAEVDAALAKLTERCPGQPFGINVRADQTGLDRLIGRAHDAGATAVSFAGAATPTAVESVHAAEMVAVATVGRRRHAAKMADIGVDAVIAQGGEGGGHTGDVPTSLLVPDVVDEVADRVVVIAAGGMHDGRSLVAALAWGADGIAMGTRFLLTAESHVPDDIKARYLAAAVTDTVRTAAIDGAPQRVIATDVVQRLVSAPPRAVPAAVANAVRFARQTGTPLGEMLREGWAMRRSQDLNLVQTAMAANAPMMTKAALVDGRADAGILPSGQVTGRIADLPTAAAVIESVMSESDRVLGRLHGMVEEGSNGPA